MSIKLRQLIRKVRSCKTAAEERAVVATEGALIRTAFKDGNEPNRARNVAKLLYMHMLGEERRIGGGGGGVTEGANIPPATHTLERNSEEEEEWKKIITQALSKFKIC